MLTIHRFKALVALIPFTSSIWPCRPVWMLYVSGCAPTGYSSIRQRRKSCGARHHVDNTRYRQPLSVSVPTQLLQRLLSVIWASTLTVICRSGWLNRPTPRIPIVSLPLPTPGKLWLCPGCDTSDTLTKLPVCHQEIEYPKMERSSRCYKLGNIRQNKW